MKHRSRSILLNLKYIRYILPLQFKCTYLKLFWLFPTLYYETYNGISSINLNFKFNTMTLKEKAAVKIKICVDLINHYCFLYKLFTVISVLFYNLLLFSYCENNPSMPKFLLLNLNIFNYHSVILLSSLN